MLKDEKVALFMFRVFVFLMKIALRNISPHHNENNKSYFYPHKDMMREKRKLIVFWVKGVETRRTYIWNLIISKSQSSFVVNEREREREIRRSCFPLLILFQTRKLLELRTMLISNIVWTFCLYLFNALYIIWWMSEGLVDNNFHMKAPSFVELISSLIFMRVSFIFFNFLYRSALTARSTMKSGNELRIVSSSSILRTYVHSSQHVYLK